MFACVWYKNAISLCSHAILGGKSGGSLFYIDFIICVALTGHQTFFFRGLCPPICVRCGLSVVVSYNISLERERESIYVKSWVVLRVLFCWRSCTINVNVFVEIIEILAFSFESCSILRKKCLMKIVDADLTRVLFQKNDFSLCNNFNNGAMGFHHMGANANFFKRSTAKNLVLLWSCNFFSFIILYCILVRFISKQKGKRRKLFY